MTEDQTDAVQGLGIDPYDLSGESHRMHAMQLSDPAVKEIFDSKAWDKICKRAEEVKLRVKYSDLLFDCILHQQPVSDHFILLPNSVSTVNSLILNGRVPPRIIQNNVRR